MFRPSVIFAMHFIRWPICHWFWLLFSIRRKFCLYCVSLHLPAEENFWRPRFFEYFSLSRFQPLPAVKLLCYLFALDSDIKLELYLYKCVNCAYTIIVKQIWTFDGNVFHNLLITVSSYTWLVFFESSPEIRQLIQLLLLKK